MTKIKLILQTILLSLTFTVAADNSDFNRFLLPDDYPVYVQGTTVINNPQPHFNKKIIPTINTYRAYPGCYVACYSHDSAKGVYPISKDIYMMGQIRVPGSYVHRICQPNKYQNKDISAEVYFKNLCKQNLASCASIECWAGGDTGGWFGIQ